MIGARLRLELDDHAPQLVSVRLADAFAAEDAIGFDPLEAIVTMGGGRMSTRAMRATVAVAWAAWVRTMDDGMTLDKFGASLCAIPVAVDDAGNPVVVDDDDAGAVMPRPTVAGPPSG